MARYALVIGIAKYKSNYLSDLSKPVKDAEAITALLQQYGQCDKEPTVLKGEVTTQQLGKAFQTFLIQQAANSEAIIYFTGHGINIKDPLGQSQGYLATSNCEVSIDREQQVVDQKQAIPFSSLNSLIQQANLSSLVMLIDACHSGDFIERTLIEQSFTAFNTKQDYYLITACRGFEKGWAKKSENHSIFTGAILEGLVKEKADDKGRITGDRLFDHLSTALKDSRQEPVRFGKGRSIVIIQFQPKQPQINFSEDCPYQGLEAFTIKTRQFFYGREETVTLLKERITRFNFVPVIGPSGSGKSSLVRAGLIPDLGDEWHVLEPIKPDAEPMAALRQAMRTLFKRASDRNEVNTLINEEGLLPVLMKLSESPFLNVETQKLLLVIDQFEEVFTVCPLESERVQFIDCITAVQTVENSPLVIMTTMRADFVEFWLDYGDLVQTIQDQAVWLGRLKGSDLVRVIEQPAKDQGYTLGPGLLDLILDDVKAEKNCLPLLEFALTELWQWRDIEKRMLPLKAYQDMQRLTGALNKRAEEVYTNDLTTEKERQWARRICLELVRIGPDIKDTRQRHPREMLLGMGQTKGEQDTIHEVIGTLVSGRLLVPTKEGEVDLAHEALMVGWKRFAAWRQDNRDRRRLIQRVRDAEKEWQSKKKDDRYLLQRGLLAEVREQWQTLQAELTLNTKLFFLQSDQYEHAQKTTFERALVEAELREQTLKMMNLITAQPVIAAATAIKNAGASEHRLGQVIASAQKGLHTTIERVREFQRCQGHKYSVNSVAFSPNGQTIVSGSSDRTIRTWDLQGNLIGEPFQGHEDSVNSVAFSPGGQIIASAGGHEHNMGSVDNTVRLWDLRGNPIGKPFLGHEDAVNSVAFSPDGHTVASCSGYHTYTSTQENGEERIIRGSDYTVRLWDLKGNPISEPFLGHEDAVNSVAFSPDGHTVVSASNDSTVRLWDLQGNSIGKPFLGHKRAVECVVFSPDGQTILSGGWDGIRLWDLKGNLVWEISDDLGWVYSVVFSSDGQTIASGHINDTVRLWDLQGNPIGEAFQRHEGFVYSVAFSPNNQIIASGSMDCTVRLWDMDGNSIGKALHFKSSPNSSAFGSNTQTICTGNWNGTIRLLNLRGDPIGLPFERHVDNKPVDHHKNVAESIAFSPDECTIAGGFRDGTVRLWDLQGHPIGKPFLGHKGFINCVAFSPNGHVIASASSDNTLQVWNLHGEPISEPFLGHNDSVNSVAFSPDGQTIVSGSTDKTIRLWDLQGNLICDPLRGHTDIVEATVFSTDGKLIASGSWDRTIRLWDSEGHPVGEPFQGHESAVTCISFSFNSQVIVSGDGQGTVRMWDLQGNPLCNTFHHKKEEYIKTVAFTSSNQIISCSNLTLRLWRGGSWDNWLAKCCTRFRHHPLFKNPQREPFISACEVCERHAWSKGSE